MRICKIWDADYPWDVRVEKVARSLTEAGHEVHLVARNNITSVTQLKGEVRDQGPVLSALKRQEKESALTRAISDYETFVQDVWGPTGKAAQENSRATEEIIQLVRRSVEKVASQRGLELVLDATGGFIIYADKSLDMTNDVLAELNANAAGGQH